MIRFAIFRKSVCSTLKVAKRCNEIKLQISLNDTANQIINKRMIYNELNKYFSLYDPPENIIG